MDLGELKLERGFTARIVIQSDSGEPLSGVKVDSMSRYVRIRKRQMGFSIFQSTNATSDDAGVIELDHLTEDPVRISLIAPGYEYSKREITFSKDATIDWKLTPSAPLSGRLVDAAGNGIAGVELHLARRDGSAPRMNDPRENFLVNLSGGRRVHEPMAVSDSGGNFKVDSLRSDTNYWLMTLHPDYRPHIIRRVHP